MSKAFISYSWDSNSHKEWVADLAARLRDDGIDVALDKWDLVPGDQIPAFMERAVRESDFVLIVCTARYKARSDRRAGGVGYEGDIMSGEVLTGANSRKFIPILREGKWAAAAPTWLAGKYYINFSANPYAESQYDDLLNTLRGTRSTAPPLGGAPSSAKTSSAGVTAHSLSSVSLDFSRAATFEPIKIVGVMVDHVGRPRSDGTPGSALYDVPFRLSSRPPAEWGQLFVASWDHPPRFTMMHRPGTALVIGDVVHLRSTTVDEVQRYHRDTLVLCVDEANRKYAEMLSIRLRDHERQRKRMEDHAREVQEKAKGIKFD